MKNSKSSNIIIILHVVGPVDWPVGRKKLRGYFKGNIKAPKKRQMKRHPQKKVCMSIFLKKLFKIILHYSTHCGLPYWRNNLHRHGNIYLPNSNIGLILESDKKHLKMAGWYNSRNVVSTATEMSISIRRENNF